MASLLPIQQFFDINGDPLTGGTLTAYSPGTTTLKTIYSIADGSIPMQNPTIGFDNYGRISTGIWGSGLYDIVIKDVNGATIWSLFSVGYAADNIVTPGGGNTSTVPSLNPNRVLNGNFQYSDSLAADNRTVNSSKLSNGSTFANNWQILTQTGPVASIVLFNETNSIGSSTTPFGVAISNGGTSQQLGIIQTIPSLSTFALRGQQVQLSTTLNCSQASTIYMAILSQTGTPGTAITNVVNSWTNPSFSPGNFFISQVNSVIGLTSSSLTANTFTTLNCSVTVPQLATNLQVFIWSSSNQGTSSIVNIGQVLLDEGAAPLGWRSNNQITDLQNAIGSNNNESDYTNFLYNTQFYLAQRQIPSTPTAVNNDVYGPDRWNVLTQTASINYNRAVSTDSSTTNTTYMGVFTQTQGSSQRFGFEQILPNLESLNLIGKQVEVKLRINVTNSQPIRIALLEWTGTADAVTSNVVNNWTSSNYTAGNFFLTSNLTVNTVASITPIANTWTDIRIKGAIVGNSVNNLIAFVWTEGVAAQNFVLNTTAAIGVRDIHPLVAKVYNPKKIVQDIAECQAYYEKSYDVDTPPGSVTVNGSFAHLSLSSTTNIPIPINFKVSKHAIPTTIIYNPTTGATGVVRDVSSGADVAASFINTGLNNTCANITGAVAANHIYMGCWTAEAEL